MTIQRIKNIINYGGKLVKPANVSGGRWTAMIKMAQKELRG